ncbi:MAG: paaE, partial [Caulobacteraceae bacterium]|nr:paaE [Caulobacteraceae bacterium]
MTDLDLQQGGVSRGLGRSSQLPGGSIRPPGSCIPGARRTLFGARFQAYVSVRMDPIRTAYICDAVRTPIGLFGVTLSEVRDDDLAALTIKALMSRKPGQYWGAV